VASPVTESDLRRAVARFAAGVTVVASQEPDGQLRGMTVSAFLFVSFEPPLILVSMLKGVPTLHTINGRGAFGVSILGVDQQQLSDRFAGDEDGRFEHVAHDVAASGAVTLPGAIATLECAVDQLVELGDHVLLVGQVQAATFREGRPLLYYRGKYGSFHSLSESHVPRWPAEEELSLAHHAAYWH
jgi:flavin reductase (DIM6/NTAB) family NADH-FMN oxidoreductase RutF